MTSTQTPEVEKIRATIESLPPTQQKRFIDDLPVPEDKENVVALLMLLREGAAGNLSRFENVKNAYLRKYNEVLRKTESLLDDQEQKAIELPRPNGGVIGIVLGVIAAVAAIVACIVVIILLVSGIKGCSSGKESHEVPSNIEEYEALQKEYEKLLTEAQSVDDKLNNEDSNAKKTDNDSDFSSLSYLNSDGTTTMHLSGTVAKAPVIMDLTVDFKNNKIRGDYYYVRIPGKQRIQLRGDLSDVKIDEYAASFKAIFQELDSDGNPTGGTFSGSGDVASWNSSELIGKYLSVKGKESEVYLFNEEKQ